MAGECLKTQKEFFEKHTKRCTEDPERDDILPEQDDRSKDFKSRGKYESARVLAQTAKRLAIASILMGVSFLFIFLLAVYTYFNDAAEESGKANSTMGIVNPAAGNMNSTLASATSMNMMGNLNSTMDKKNMAAGNFSLSSFWVL
ncbi:hypothetical protein ElyMa_002441700 [Elysia marginata]|uniref:Uncharacterized protein n=1 Tax=Elysia marginata TaxID=1093978 RepID=A0AAV4GIV4_9GAST|nr:hypothetical protein ElyMa_002441700 [Elysia marginata]